MLKKYCKLNTKEYSNINYIVYLPEKTNENMPLLLFLHGIGERGENIENIELKIVENDNHFLTSHAFKDKYLYEWLKKNI